MKIYFVTDENGYIVGGISTGKLEGKNVKSVDVDEEHEIFKSDAECFKFVEGQLIKDKERQKKIIEEGSLLENKPTVEQEIADLWYTIMMGGFGNARF